MIEISSNRVDRIDSVVGGTTTTLLGIFEGPSMTSDAPTDTMVEVMLILPYHLYEASANETFAGQNIIGLARTLDRSSTIGGKLTTTATGGFSIAGFASTNDRYIADSYRNKAGTLVSGAAMNPGASKGIAGDTNPRVVGMFDTSVVLLGL
jgi:hypothetical protein